MKKDLAETCVPIVMLGDCGLTNLHCIPLMWNCSVASVADDSGS